MPLHPTSRAQRPSHNAASGLRSGKAGGGCCHRDNAAHEECHLCRAEGSMITLLDVYQNGKGNPIPGAVEVLYELLRERPPEANISHHQVPTFSQHELYVRSKPYRSWFLVLNDYQQRVGAVSLTRN